MRISCRMIAAAAALAVCMGAHADESADSWRGSAQGRSVVHYGDLDIGTEQGAKIMLQRIERAAAKACGGHPTFSPATGALDSTFRECRNTAVQRAVQQLAAPIVTRLYAEARPRQS